VQVGASPTASVNVWLAEPLVSAAITVTLKGEPAIVVGTPLIVPVALSITRLDGKPDAVQVFVPLPPLATTVAE
jgi:hypothetical protein